MIMKIIKVKSQGFCRGVMASIIKVSKTLQDPTIPKPIHMLGSLVHNHYIVTALKNKGIVLVEGNNRLEMIDKIERGTVIFTAHGVSDLVFLKAKEKGLTIVDATCKDVFIVHELVKEKIGSGYVVLFMGKKGHPETEAILTIDPSIVLVEKEEDVPTILSKTKKIVLTNQTTLSYQDVVFMYERLLKSIPHLELIEEVCGATRTRQSAVIEAAKEADFVLVVGDAHSHNTRMLKEVVLRYTNTPSISIENLNELNNYNLSSYETIAVTSGASTPRAIVDEIVEALSNYNFNKKYKSTLSDDDYLKG